MMVNRTSQNRIKEYITIVEKVAKVEHRRIPSHMVDYEELVSIGIIAIQAMVANKSEEQLQEATFGEIFYLFHKSSLFHKSFVKNGQSGSLARSDCPDGRHRIPTLHRSDLRLSVSCIRTPLLYRK